MSVMFSVSGSSWVAPKEKPMSLLERLEFIRDGLLDGEIIDQGDMDTLGIMDTSFTLIEVIETIKSLNLELSESYRDIINMG
jgi:hypothetical protein